MKSISSALAFHQTVDTLVSEALALLSAGLPEPLVRFNSTLLH